MGAGVSHRLDEGAAPRPLPLPCRVDLRTTTCSPYPPVEDQGATVSCVAHSFCALLYCLKAGAGLKSFPVTGLPYPRCDAIFRSALATSRDRARGVSFPSVARELRGAHATDLASLGLALTELPNDSAAVRGRLACGFPVAAGYQVNRATDEFHRDPAACAARGFVLPRFSRDPVAVSAHAVLLVGYDGRVGCFIARNSWGGAWGVDGHFLVTFADVEDGSFFTDLMSVRALHEAAA